MPKYKKYLKNTLLLFAVFVVLLICKTAYDIKTPSLSLRGVAADSQRFQVLDRSGKPLGISYKTSFNNADIVPLYEVPEFLRNAFIISEDQHFFEHSGVDFRARASALWQNIHAGKKVRGASTITEQVVRIIHQRPRNLWSRWLEGFEAILLENKASKGEILEFYLNQVPYAANRRGIAQAARYYFNRDVGTLTHKEMLALAVLPRAPSAFDLYKNPEKIEASMARLAQTMADRGKISEQEKTQIIIDKFVLEPPPAQLSATHFINYIRETIPYNLSENGTLLTTLDADLQNKAQSLLDERVKALKHKQVHNGAVLIVDYTNGEILAWAVAGAGDAKLKSDTPAGEVNAVLSPRQAGSSMKPFLYALALDSGWSPATILDDAPMAEAIGGGLHDFHNYSRTFYGKISLREALGNSLNIPALETINFVTPARYLDTLHLLGFASLNKPVEFYKEGLALGNGEVTLFEMVQAYSAIANRGIFRPLTPLSQPPFTRESKRVYSQEATSIIANILSDPFARRREFGASSVLNLPVQTAVKTGTSTDYHDAWVMGFNSHYMVGVWLGNLNQSPMDGITGSTGPALVLRGIFYHLATQEKAKPLYLSPKLVQKEVCSNYEDTAEKNNCFPRTEYFIAGTENTNEKSETSKRIGISIARPTEGLQIAYDPRIPASTQEFEFVADGITQGNKVEWFLNDKSVATTLSGHLLWAVTRGKYTLVAKEFDDAKKLISSDLVHFNVK